MTWFRFNGALAKFLVVCLFFLSACQGPRNKDSQPITNLENNEISAPEKLVKKEEKAQEVTPKKEKVFDLKKLGKELVSILTWDVVIAEICRNGLALAPAICVAADLGGDVAIILYHNQKVDEKTPPDSKEISEKKDSNSAAIISQANAAESSAKPADKELAEEKATEKKKKKYEFKLLNLLLDALIAVIVVALV